MTIIVFLIDTSSSMNQRTFIGARPTLLDIAKGAVESFVKLRQRNAESRFDRYMLFTSEEQPHHIKAGWKENLATFMNELKNIKATGLSIVGPAIKNVFDVLNINRMQSGIDTYNSGRSPFFLEPSMIVCISDGGKLSSSQGVQDDLFPFPKSNPIPGAELTREIFRWDQRLFGLILRLTGTPTPETMGLVPSDNSPMDKLCEQTGGRSYAVRTHRMFQQCIESLVQKVQSGVVINFEKIGPDPPPIVDTKENIETVELERDLNALNDPNLQTNGSGPGLLGAGPGNSCWNSAGPGSPGYVPANGNITGPGASNGTALPNGSSNTNPMNSTAWHNCRKMIYVPRPPHRGGHGCFWPIPEAYWPDANLLSLPARNAHPNLKFTCSNQEPMVIDNLPFDKYELEPSPLTQFILSRKQPTVCWQVYIANSSKNSDVGHPFGYLKASTTKPCVNLFVMPYNYPVLLPLLDDLFKTHRLKPTKEWRQQFDNYLRTMPPYYASPLKRALERMGVSNLISDKLDSSLSFQVMSHLKRLKNQAKLEYEKICAEVEKRVSLSASLAATASQSSMGPTSTEGIRVYSRRPLSRNLTSNHLLKSKVSHLCDQVTEFSNFTLSVRDSLVQPQLYRNPFDINRTQLIDQLARMRANFLQPSLHHLLTDKGQDQLHCKPISQMGNYQDYLKKMNPPLREIESAPVRQHMFGNPFKIDKRMSMMVDEADVDLMGTGGGQASPGAGRGLKRPSETVLMNNRAGKRRKGPIPSDFTLQRRGSISPSNSFQSTPIPSPIPSPISSPIHFGSEESPVIDYNAMNNTIPYSSPIHPIVVMGSPAIAEMNFVPIAPEPSTPPPSPGMQNMMPMTACSQQGVLNVGGDPMSNLTPSPAIITPGYMPQISPPISPAHYSTDVTYGPVSDSSNLVVNGEFVPMKRESLASYEPDSDDDISESYQARKHTDVPDVKTEETPKLRIELKVEAKIKLAENSDSDSQLSVGERNGVVSDDELMGGWTGSQQEVDTAQTKTYNRRLLTACYKAVKKPGRDFSPLFSQLRMIQGSRDSQLQIVNKVMQEALRFKRHSLVGILTQKIELHGSNGCSTETNSFATLFTSVSKNGHNPNIVVNGHSR